MLIDLHIENFAIAQSVSMQPGPGLNVLTGETGAGKSIIVDALSLVTGGRGDSELIRTNAESCVVEALFDVSRQPHINELLKELGFEVSDQLLISREITRSGRSRSRINGKMCTVSNLAQIGALLLNIYGQHDQAALSNNESHLIWLDNFGKADVEMISHKVADLYTQFREVNNRLHQIQHVEKMRNERLELLQYQQEELAKARLKIGEEVELRQERDILANAQRLIEKIAKAYQVLSGDLQEGSVMEGLSLITGLIQEASSWDERLVTVQELIESSAAQLEEVAISLRKTLDNIRNDPQRLKEVEERLALINRLMRKYDRDVPGLINLKGEIEKEIEGIRNLEKDQGELQQQFDQLKTELSKEALKLSTKRRELAKEFSNAVEEGLKQLAMERARFIVDISQQFSDSPMALPIEGKNYLCTEKGIDQVQFLFSANPGEEPKPLQKVASGGELSRLMLAIKSILVQGENIPTLVFDEVDAGIGGRTATHVAEKLHEAASNSQVLVVTHLAQIAIRASNHFQVEKSSTDGDTQVTLTELKTDEERITEIARMLDGSMDKATLQHAATMLHKAQSTA